jgi:subtilisin-like proprotein convertase family protein
VTLNIQHTWDADLDVFLVSPAGTRVLLFSGVGGSGHDFTNTVLDDTAATPITLGSAPFTGSFRPQGQLSSLVGQSANGTWTLEVDDTGAPDNGTLLNWSLTLGLANEPISVSDANGAYAFTNLAPGSYQVREVVRTGWTQTLPGDPNFRYSVALSSGQVLLNQDFGNQGGNRTGPLVVRAGGTGKIAPGRWAALAELHNLAASLTGPGSAGLVMSSLSADRTDATDHAGFAVLGTTAVRTPSGAIPRRTHQEAIVDQLFTELGDVPFAQD